ncbi:MAG: DUF4214 domain-containing protein [Pseudomonadales bacterium]|nr:DUF4214 domain-containing protein [Pseudomonadales bacterium]
MAVPSTELVQQAYIAYYGRPADPDGWAYWIGVLDASGGDLANIIQDFGNSTEFLERYGNLDNEALINNVYLQLLNREPDQAGLDFYLQFLNSGELTLQDITLQILSGAQNEDLDLINKKVEAATYFTIRVPASDFDYSSSDAADQARALMDQVTLETTSTTTLVDTFLSEQANTGTLSISGSAIENQTLSIDLGVIDNAASNDFQIQWLRDNTAVTGETGTTYVLGDADVGTIIAVQVTYQSTDSETVTLSDSTATINNINDNPSGSPVIEGQFSENNTLTANIDNISDADGLGDFSFQWLRDGAAISNATSGQYTLTTADLDADISVQVRYLDGHGTQEVLTSAVVNADNSNTEPEGKPAISGSAIEDSTLTVDTDEISDADGLGEFSYQWNRNGSLIEGATEASYTLTDDDVDANINVTVSYTDGKGNAEAVSSDVTSEVDNINDDPVGDLVITGTASEGSVLTADMDGVTDDDGLGTFFYTWLRDGEVISDAKSSTYTLEDEDVGSTLSVVVKYEDGHGTEETLRSESTAVVTNENDAPEGNVVIQGSATENVSLLAFVDNISDGDGLGTFSYQWYRDGTEVKGATSSTYKLGDDDVDKSMTVTVSYTDQNGTFESLTSTATESVLNVNDDPEGTISILGFPIEDQRLSAFGRDSITDDDGLGEFSYRWYRDGQAISGATDLNYTLTQQDVGASIGFTISWVDDFGTFESISAETTPDIIDSTRDYDNNLSIGDAGNSLASAAEVSYLSEIDGIVGFGKDDSDGVDWYRIDTPISGTLSITLSGHTENLDLYLYDKTGSLLDSSTKTSTNQESISDRVDVPNNQEVTRYIVVDTVDDNASQYELNIFLRQDTDADLLGNFSGDAGNNFDNARALGDTFSPITGTIGVNSDSSDFYSFQVDESRVWDFELQFLSADADLHLYNNSGILLSSSTASGTQNESFSSSLTTGQTYYVEIEAQSITPTEYWLEIA